MPPPRLKKAILRPLEKVRLDVDAEGRITPVMIRLEPQGEPIVVSRVDYVDDRITEVWFEVETRCGDRLVLRVERERLRWELQTVESVNPDRYRGWFEAQEAERAEAERAAAERAAAEREAAEREAAEREAASGGAPGE